MTKEDMRQQKAKALRYKKPMMSSMNLDFIRESVDAMQEEIYEVQWFVEDEESLTNALCGDEDEAYEFKMAFADLSVELEVFENDLQEAWVPSCFDELFPLADTGFGYMMGYDSYEDEYFGLDPYQYEVARKGVENRLTRMTKKELLEAVGASLKIYASFTALQYRYDCLSASLNIIRDKNISRLKLIKAIEEAYDKADKSSDGFRHKWDENVQRLDTLLFNVPQEYWIQ